MFLYKQILKFLFNQRELALLGDQLKKKISPKYLNIFFVLPFLFHLILPIIRIINEPFKFVGIAPFLLGIILNIWSLRVLMENTTTIDFNGITTNLVTTGPFNFSRNPIYLSGVIILLGIAIFLGSLITFVFPVVLLLIMDKFYIPFEERKLEGIFGDEYLKYKQKVRKWI